jgi:hypothetical protein
MRFKGRTTHPQREQSIVKSRSYDRSWANTAQSSRLFAELVIDSERTAADDVCNHRANRQAPSGDCHQHMPRLSKKCDDPECCRDRRFLSYALKFAAELRISRFLDGQHGARSPMSSLPAATLHVRPSLRERRRTDKRVMPAVLHRLMRHAEIATTMKHYVTMDADVVADEVWSRNWQTDSNLAVGNIFGNNPPQTARNAEGAPDAGTSETPSGETLNSGGHGARTRNPITGAPHFQCGR